VLDIAADVPVLAGHVLRDDVAAKVGEHGGLRADCALALLGREEAAAVDAEREHVLVLAQEVLELVGVEAAEEPVVAVPHGVQLLVLEEGGQAPDEVVGEAAEVDGQADDLVEGPANEGQALVHERAHLQEVRGDEDGHDGGGL